MSVITDFEAQADLFGTFRVTVFYRNEAGEDSHAVIHNVPQEAVEAAIEAILLRRTKLLRRPQE